MNKGKFTLEIKRFSCITRARCIDAKTVKCARLPLLSILSDKNRRAYQQLSIFARLMSISTGVKKNALRNLSEISRGKLGGGGGEILNLGSQMR